MKCIFSVDVEDWFHILDLPAAPPPSQWDSLPSRVERNFTRLLDIFSELNVQVTCFFLGWVAERFPRLVKEAAGRRHEIASHGHRHRLIYQMTRAEFLDDATRSKKTIEDITGREVMGYRASGFSVTEKTPWFFNALGEAGYRYDSSVFPAARAHGGLAGSEKSPHHVGTAAGDLIEFPMTVSRLAGRSICFFGGGYLRLFPLWVIKKMTRQVLREGRPVIFYVHPREIDPNHPRLPMSFARSFKCYVNLKTTEGKIRGLLSSFSMTTFEDWLARYFDAPMASSTGHEAAIGAPDGRART
ncbi:MAG TPA: XrtA system polysaccharide deacetylase [Terriglobia bacterium]|nr:XrtA system polysaccharide deacetylase [Terriglobia bacterium]